MVFVIIGMDVENKEPVVGFRVGSYIQGKTCVAPIDNITNVPRRMKDVVNVSFSNYLKFIYVYKMMFISFVSVFKI